MRDQWPGCVQELTNNNSTWKSVCKEFYSPQIKLDSSERNETCLDILRWQTSTVLGVVTGCGIGVFAGINPLKHIRHIFTERVIPLQFRSQKTFDMEKELLWSSNWCDLVTVDLLICRTVYMLPTGGRTSNLLTSGSVIAQNVCVCIYQTHKSSGVIVTSLAENSEKQRHGAARWIKKIYKNVLFTAVKCQGQMGFRRNQKIFMANNWLNASSHQTQLFSSDVFVWIQSWRFEP